jgi:hypothetical protein
MKCIENNRQHPLNNIPVNYVSTKNSTPIKAHQTIKNISIPKPSVMGGIIKDLLVRKVSAVNRERQTIKTIMMHRRLGDNSAPALTGLFHDLNQKAVR